MTRRNPGPPLRRDRLEQALEAAGLGEYEWDVDADVMTLSERAAEICGLPAGSQPASGGALASSHIHPEDRAAYDAARKASLEAGGPFVLEHRFIRPDDQRTVWLRVSGVVIRDGQGPLCVIGIVQDVSRLKAEEAQRLTLMAELDHRVKNSLAAVQALAAQTAKRTRSVEAFVDTFGGRLKAMASANELLAAARWRGAAVDHLAAAELGALAPGQTSWDGPELFLTPRAANALSLALHELAANAVKYGALSNEAGHVDVRWRWLSDGEFELRWTESGGPAVSPPAHRGFGFTLLDQVTGRELSGAVSVDYRPQGVQATIRGGRSAVAQRPDVAAETVPARAAEAAPTLAHGPSNLSGARVLIVEDAVLLALELDGGLRDAGAQVIGPAYDLPEALSLLDQPIDAAVLDANLDGLSVSPVAEALAARGVPFVFATGYGDVGGPGGFDAPVIRKPYDVSQVVSALAELLRDSPPQP